jgi:hypothetical protein
MSGTDETKHSQKERCPSAEDALDWLNDFLGVFQGAAGNSVTFAYSKQNGAWLVADKNNKRWRLSEVLAQYAIRFYSAPVVESAPPGAVGQPLCRACAKPLLRKLKDTLPDGWTCDGCGASYDETGNSSGSRAELLRRMEAQAPAPVESSQWARDAAREILFPDGEALEGYGEADIDEVAKIISRCAAGAVDAGGAPGLRNLRRKAFKRSGGYCEAQDAMGMRCCRAITEHTMELSSDSEAETIASCKECCRVAAPMSDAGLDHGIPEVHANPRPQQSNATPNTGDQADAGGEGTGWVSVQEKLPHTHTVLGYIVDRPAHPIYVGGEPFVDTVCYFPKHDHQRVFTEVDGLIPESGEWRLGGRDDEDDRGVVVITHWQPLPAPPAEPQEGSK